MTTIELQNNIIRKVLSINDNQLLGYLNQILEKEETKIIYELSDSEEKLINESLEEYEKGQTTTHKDIVNQTEKWLKE